MEFVHKSVLFDEAIKALDLNENKIIVDGTAGGGGHSGEIAKRAKRVISIDQDPDAIAVLNERLGDKENVTIVHDNYSNIKNIISNLNIEKIDGLLLDLGVSSFQLDTAERGFSFHKDAPLDMRMSKSGLSAYDVVNEYSKEQLEKILFEYGEEKFAHGIVGGILKAREEAPIKTTLELAEIVKRNVPLKVRREKNPCKKTFQAIRIEVNGELDELKKGMSEAFERLSKGGRLAIITFHSIEDRIVKNTFRDYCTGCTCPPDFPVCVCGKKPRGELVYRKPITAGEEELSMNNRSRSAKLRVIEKL